MEHTERNHKIAQELYDTIRKLLNSKNLETKIPEAKIHGIAIFYFPEDHKKTTEVTSTCIGKICLSHLMAATADICGIPILGVEQDAG